MNLFQNKTQHQPPPWTPSRGGHAWRLKSQLIWKQILKIWLKKSFQSHHKSSTHRPFVYASSALAGAATTSLAFAKPFVASDAAVGFSYFFPKEKGLGPAAMSGKRH